MQHELQELLEQLVDPLELGQEQKELAALEGTDQRETSGARDIILSNVLGSSILDSQRSGETGSDHTLITLNDVIEIQQKNQMNPN
ncbi:hypothetical protein Tco_0013069 [Tanacetum coccineum]